MKGCMQLKSVNSWEDFHLQCVANPLDSWGGGGGGAHNCSWKISLTIQYNYGNCIFLKKDKH